jgi:hypothetical protein
MAIRWTEAYSSMVFVLVTKTSIKAIWVIDASRKVSYKVYEG